MMKRDILKNFLAAVGFLSLLPVGRSTPLTPEDFGRLPAYYPAVGLVLGCVLALAWLPAGGRLPPDLAALALVVLLTAVTRGFHIDGLADAADALFSHRPREQKLLIMKDSRQGTFGVLAIVLDLVLKIQLLAHLLARPAALAPAALVPAVLVPAVLVLWPAWGRLGASAVAVLSDYVGGEAGLGRFMVEKSGFRELGLAALSTLVLSLFFGPPAFLTAAAALAFGLGLVPVWRRALGGVTGDLLGASVELTEIFSLIVFYLLTLPES